MTNKVTFKDLLITYRGSWGWTQEELGQLMGVHRNTIASWESGTIPSRGVVLRLIDELITPEKDQDEFLKAAGYREKPGPIHLWNVPYQHNRYFMGREKVLERLRHKLVPGARTTALTQSISGLGGIGKTQVAVEYAHLYGEYYKAVLWVPADSLGTATAAWLQIATELLGLPEQQKAEDQVAAIKSWLQKCQNWLLIFDNVEDPQTILSTFVPTRHQGSVLITTRRRDLGKLADKEELPLFSEDDAVLFLLRRTEKIAREAKVTEATADDYNDVRELSQLLGRLPLALDQAGAYVEAIGCSLKDYIDRYHQFRKNLLNLRDRNDQSSGSPTGSDHPDSVFITFKLSWEQIQQRNLLAGKALLFCAFLAPDQIPVELIANGVEISESGNAHNALEMDEALGLLHRYSLVKRAEQTLSLHRLVQEVMQDVLSEEERQQWMEQAVLGINAVFPNGEHGTWPLCAFLLPHALACAKWVPLLRQKKLEGTRLLNDTGRYLHERAQYQEAEPLHQRALAIQEEQLGPSHPETATTLDNLAELYRVQGRYQEAEPLHQRALVIREKQLGASHPDTAISLNKLALLYWVQGRYREAEPLYQRALAINEKQLGAFHPEIATTLNNLAGLYRVQGRYQEAEPLLQRALTIQEEQLGVSHPQTATSLNNLALLYWTQDRYQEAEPLYQHALVIREEQLGAFHPDTAISLNNLAALYEGQGRYEEAEPLFLRALTIQEEQLGTSHTDTARGLNNLAALYEGQGRYEEAEPLLQRALAIQEKQLGASHPETATSLNNLAELYRVQGRYQEAEPLFQRVLSIAEEQLGVNHPNTAATLGNLAKLYRAQGRYGEAEQLYQRVRRIYEEQ